MKGYDSCQIKIKDGLYIRLYYKNHFFHTPYRLPERVPKGVENPYFNEHLKKLRKTYGSDYLEVNKVLQEKKAIINRLIVEADGKGINPIAHIKLHFAKANQAVEKELLSYSTLLLEQFEKWFDKKVKKLSSNKRTSVIEVPKAIIENLKHFQKDRNKKFMLSNLDMDWVYDFSRWCVTQKKRTIVVHRKSDNCSYTTTKKIQMSNSTLIRHLIEIRAFLKDTSLLNENLIFPVKEIKEYYTKLPTRYLDKKQKKDGAYNYLNQDEWNVVKTYQVPSDRRKEWHQVYDMYIFSCFTGLRFGDLKKVTRLDINNGILQLEPEKNQTKVLRGKVTLKLSERALEIIRKYNSNDMADDEPMFGHILSTNQQSNIILRKILAEIPILQTKQAVYSYYLKDESEKEYKRKCDILSWHSSRRTFVNLLVAKGANVQMIQTMTGWTDIKSIISYMDQVQKDDPRLNIVNSF